ncbi:MAG: GntR family transcriptional regulator [Parvularculaceae bacterium]
MSDFLLPAAAATDDGAITDKDQARSEKIHEQVYQRLRWAIISGQLDPGKSISVRGLAAEFGVSTMPAREAIRRLVTLNALELTPTRRVTVAKMTFEKYRELVSARLALEPELAVKAMRMAREEPGAIEQLVSRLREIDSVVDDAIRDRDSAAYARGNCEFHYSLYLAAKSPVYLRLVESLWLQLGPFMRSIVLRIGGAIVVDEHKAAIEAIEAGDEARLEHAIRQDITDALEYVLPTDFKP